MIVQTHLNNKLVRDAAQKALDLTLLVGQLEQLAMHRDLELMLGSVVELTQAAHKLLIRANIVLNAVRQEEDEALFGKSSQKL